MRVQQPEYSCDNCGKSRTKDVNHWFVLYDVSPPSAVNGGTIEGARAILPDGLVVRRWNEKLAAAHSAAHACGEQCMISLTQRFFATGSFEKPKLAVEEAANAN